VILPFKYIVEYMNQCNIAVGYEQALKLYH